MDWLNNIFGGVKSLFGGAGQAIGGAAKSVAGAGANIGKSLFNQFNPSQMMQGVGQIGAPKPATSSSQGGAGMFSMPLIGALGGSQMPGMSGISTGGSPGFENDINPDKKKSGSMDWLSQLFPGGKASGIAGLAAPALGNLFAPKTPDIPDFGSLSSVQAMQNFKPGSSVSPEYQKMIQDNVGQLREQKVRELQALYHNARPGTDYLTDTNYQRDLALLDQGIQENLTNDLTQAEATFSGQEQERLSQLAQMDIYSIMAQTGMAAQEAQQFKEMFSNVGNVFLTNATRDPNDMNNLMELFNRKGVA